MNFSDFLDFLFPNSCLGCGTVLAGGAVACAECAAAVPLHAAFFCAECGAPLRGGALRCSGVPFGAEYGDAIRGDAPFPRREAPACHYAPYVLGAACAYENGFVKGLIHALKFENIRAAADPLADLLARYFESAQTTAEAARDYPQPLVVPVPLHPARERERGFNQAGLIAERFAALLGLPYADNILFKVRRTAAQHELSREARRANLRDCFAAPRDPRAAGRSVILVDDVVTSGATFREAATVLLESGASQVLAIATAKA